MNIKIAGKQIGQTQPAFIVAEAGINHNGNVRIAKKMISSAKDCGADAIKFQTFRAHDLASKSSKYFKIFEKVEIDYADLGELSDHAKREGIIFFSTPFSEEAVDVLADLRVPAFKIASGDITHIPLIRYVASKKKPVIISTGMSNFAEIDLAVRAIKSQKNDKIVIMHSVTSYPTPPSDANLRVINTLEHRYKYPIGYSDNGEGVLVPVIAVSLGARMIEKHFTLSKKLKGPDHYFSADPNELSMLVRQIRETEKILGDGKKIPQHSELENIQHARRSIVATADIKKGSKITSNNIAVKRPGTGIMPLNFHKVIGSSARRSIKIDQPIKWSDIKQ
ncbi:MAG: N-acetylneuraminate synthase family protein [Candidatus Nitrosotenuis sp.]